LNITREEAQALGQILLRGKFAGEEVTSVAVLLQKLQQIANTEPTPTEKPKLKKKTASI